MEAEGLVVEGLSATAYQAQIDVVGEEGDHSWPIELMMDVLDHLCEAWVSSQAKVMMGVKDIHSDVLIVGDIE